MIILLHPATRRIYYCKKVKSSKPGKYRCILIIKSVHVIRVLKTTVGDVDSRFDSLIDDHFRSFSMKREGVEFLMTLNRENS